jgi:Serine/threonine protein phosphatase
MGVCVPCDSTIRDNIVYNEEVVISIKEKDRLGKVFRSDKVKFKLPFPIISQTESINLNKLNLNVSACVMGGIDPRSVLNKECQDGLVYFHKDNVFIAVVFDGHGIDGIKIVDFAKDYIKKYFMANTVAFKTAPTETIVYIITEIDKIIRQPTSGIDCLVSGSTAIIAVITDVLHIGSVGDSRAILAMLGSSDPKYTPKKRFIEPIRPLFPLKLTVDQKPNIREELERIKKAGGKVQQLTNEQNVKIGPYRVWKKTGTLPGLAMSRSIGDTIGKEIGVISTPICNSFMFDKSTDLFIVLASDGIWDVMENTDVIHFIDKFSKICRNESSSVEYPLKVRKN